MIKVQNISQAREFFYQYIPTSTQQKFAGAFGLERPKYLLSLLNNPQEQIKVIHIAGTSGKGSTAYLTSRILHSLGFKVGLHISPHLIDFRERFQINNNLIDKDKFVDYVNKFIPYVEKLKKTKYASITYFELMVVFTYYFFAEEKVNYAVIETGMGGTWDATNVITNPNKLTIITKIGLDHTKILGKNLTKIALQKTGIIQENNQVVALWQKPSVVKIINQTVKTKKAKLTFVKKYLNYSRVAINSINTTFDFSLSNCVLKNIKLNLLGLHQVENASLALAACCVLSKRDQFAFDKRLILNSLAQSHFPGRMEIIKKNNKTLVLDGAHNPQKMASFISSLKKLYPNKKFTFLIAFKKGKDYKKMLHYIVPLAKEIITTDFSLHDQDLYQQSEDPLVIKNEIMKLGFNKNTISKDKKTALNKALSANNDTLVITGSLYLLSTLYKYI